MSIRRSCRHLRDPALEGPPFIDYTATRTSRLSPAGSLVAHLEGKLAYQSDAARVAGKHGLRNVEVRAARRKVALIAGAERVK
jgi:hypothetical protein